MDITANENSMLSDKEHTPGFHVQITRDQQNTSKGELSCFPLGVIGHGCE